MKAVIVAAGRSSRLYPLTLETPKSLLPVVGETSLLERAVDLLNANGITDVVVVVGFQHEKIRAALHDRVRFVLNPFYTQTNNMGSLWLAIPHLHGAPFIYSHADVVYDEALLSRLVDDETVGDMHLLVDFGHVDEEAMKVRVEDGRFVESSKAIPLSDAAGEWTGLARVSAGASAHLYACIETLLDEQCYQDYDTSAFNRLAQSGMTFGLTPTEGLPWCEIDTHADLDRARLLFKSI